MQILLTDPAERSHIHSLPDLRPDLVQITAGQDWDQFVDLFDAFVPPPELQQQSDQFIIKPFSDRFCRIAGNDRIRINVTANNTAGTDDRSA